jgi:hypothetical protein
LHNVNALGGSSDNAVEGNVGRESYSHFAQKPRKEIGSKRSDHLDFSLIGRLYNCIKGQWDVWTAVLDVV